MIRVGHGDVVLLDLEDRRRNEAVRATGLELHSVFYLLSGSWFERIATEGRPAHREERCRIARIRSQSHLADINEPEAPRHFAGTLFGRHVSYPLVRRHVHRVVTSRHGG